MITPAALIALAIQCAPTVHPDTLNDIAKTESGLHPYAIAEIIPVKGGGSRVASYHPATRQVALNILEEIKARKHRYSVGMMQITSTNFPGYGVDAEDMLNPCKNLSVAEKIITDCYLRGGSLKRALSCYYSGSFTTGQRPEKSFSNTSYIQRIGYVVPSTREDRQAASPRAPDSDTADPGDPCAMVLCLAGKLNGSSPAECDPMYKNFMSIKKKKDGSFLPDHTAAARQRKLSACPTADSGLVKDIIKRFGRLKGW